MSVSARALSAPSSELRVRYRRCADLKPASRNPRTHTKKQIRQIANSIQEFGFTNPLLVDKHDRVIAGHGRLEAAKVLQLEQVPTIQLDQLSEHQIRAYIIADNKLAENAGWDRELLALELQYLTELDLDFDVSVIGFETAEIDVLIGELDPGEPDTDDDVPLPEPGPPITQPGDLWQIGPHRLICGDATQFQTYAQLLDTNRAQMVFTDPPYNVPIDGHVSGLGQVRHREFAMASGEMTEGEFIAFLTRSLSQMADFSIDGSIHFICMDWRHVRELLSATEGCYQELKNLCVWTKSNGGMGSFYRSQHELVFVFKKGQAPHINNIELGKYGRNRTNVWAYAGMSSFGTTREQELSLHPTVKPINLVADAILDCSDRGGVVLDGFAGSGTTLLAAERTGRRGYGIELDGHYCDVILRRMLAIGHSPVHVASGRKFEDLDPQASDACEEEA